MSFVRNNTPVLILLLLSVIWGSSFILMKMGMYTLNGVPVFSSQQVASLRLTLAFSVLLPFAIYFIGKTPKKLIFLIALVGIFGNGIPAFLFTAAEQKLDSSLAGMLNATTPVFAAILGIVLFGLRLKWINYLGVAIGFAGACGLMLANGTQKFTSDFGPAGLVLIATTCYALSVNIIRKYLSSVHPLAVTSIAFFVIGLPAAFWSWKCGSWQTLANDPNAPAAFGYIAVLGLAGTALAVFVFNYLVKITNAIYASTVTYLMPITSIVWGLLFKEVLNLWHGVFIAVILGGVFLSTRK